MLTFRASSVVRPGARRSPTPTSPSVSPTAADSALEYARLWAEIPGVSVAGATLVGYGVLVGDYPPRSKTQPERRGGGPKPPLWS